MARRILVTGGTGQVGRSLAALGWPAGIELILPTRAELDIANPDAVARVFAETTPDAVVSSAAYTAVDRAETEIAAAWGGNAIGPALLAAAARDAGAPIVHLSTDYVFDGTADRPYREDDATGPAGVYGASKLGGEIAVRSSGARAVILRTAWVVSPFGANFVKTMLRVAAAGKPLAVVADQHGCPTSAADIAGTVATIVTRLLDDRQAPAGTYHFVSAGEASWHDLACRIFATSAALGGPAAEPRAIPTSDYPTPARRPANSRLDTGLLAADYGIAPRPWQKAIDEVVTALVTGEPERTAR